MNLIEIACWVIVILAIGPWWALGILIRAFPEGKGIRSYRDKLVQFSMLTVASSMLAVIGANYIWQHTFATYSHGQGFYSPGLGIFLLVAAILAMEGIAIPFLVSWYRP